MVAAALAGMLAFTGGAFFIGDGDRLIGDGVKGCGFGRSGLALTAEDRLEELGEGAGFRWEIEEADEDRGDGEEDERDRHRGRGFVRVDVLDVEARLAGEGEEDEPEHVEGGEEGGDQRDDRQHLPDHRIPGDPGAEDDRILRPESGEWDDAGIREGGDEEGPESDWHVLAQAAHFLDVLLLVHAVDDGAGTEEEECLEEGVRHQVEDGRDPGTDAEREGHVAELGERGVGDDALDVVLHHADGGGHEGGEGADDGDHGEGIRCRLEDDVGAGHHVDAGGDHGGGVDEGGDGGRTLHRVRKPDVERELRALAAGAEEEEQGNPGEGADGNLWDLGEDFLEVHGAEDPEHPHDAEAEAEVTDTVDDEGFLGGVAGGATSEPETDEQVGAETDRLPEDEEEEVVVGKDQHQHAEDEEREVGEEAVVPGIALHVAGGIDVNEEADGGHHDEHGGGELVGVEGDVDVEIAGGDPAEEVLRDGFAGLIELAEDGEREQPGDENGRRGDPGGFVADDAPPEEDVHHEGEQREQRD